MFQSLTTLLGKISVSPILAFGRDGYGTADAATLRKVGAAQTELLYEMDRGSGTKPVFVFLVATLFLSNLTSALPWAAFALYCACWTYLHSLQAAFLASKDRKKDPAYWTTRFAYASLLTGIAWGFGSVVWFNPANTENQAIVALIILGVSASSAISRSMHGPSMMAFAIPASLPIILSLVITAAPFGIMMAILGGVFSMGVWQWSRSLNRSQLDSIALRFQNEELVESLKKERAIAIQAKAQAESGNRAKSEFLTTMSHEVRTPLNGILGMAHILQLSNLDEDQKESVDVIVESGETLQTVLNDILDLSKLESGRFDVDEAPFEVLPVVNSVLRLFKSNAETKGLELEIQSDLSESLRGFADDHRTRQVLLNLVGNAIKFTEQGGIGVTLAPVGSPLLPAGLPSNLQDDHIVLAITDSGIGITAEQLEQLFEPFTQADQSTTRKYGGTGLGLAISKRLVELMGGRIGGFSNDGQGSTFWFTLPSATPQQTQDAVAKVSQVESGRAAPKYILLAEDNDVNALVAEGLLRKAGHKVDRVKDGQEAIDYVTARLDERVALPDLILMDIRMPRLSGPEAAQQIRKMPAPANRLPILALTADMSYSEMREDGSLLIPKEYAGIFDGALAKPISPDRLSSAITSATMATVRLTGLDQEATTVDLTHLKELLEILGSTAFSDLIETYVNDMDRLSLELAAAIECNNIDKAADLSHSLAGASANLGFVALEAAARDLMRAAKTKDKSALSAGHEHFTGVVEQTRTVVGALKTG